LPGLLTSLRRIPAGSLLALIVLFAIALRIVFFVGLVSGDPQDDGVYYGNAFNLYTDGPRYLNLYRNAPPDFLANPIDQFNVRPMVTYPIAASFALFGPGETAATLWAFVCSTLSVLVVYRLGFLLHGTGVGLTAALLCAFYPLEVINGTRILSDVQVGFFSSLGLLLLVEGSRRRSTVFYALSGVAAAGAYLSNARGLIAFGALLAYVVVQWLLRKADWRGAVWLLAGFLAVFSIEALIYYRTTGDPLLSYRIQSGASRFKYLYEGVSGFRLGALRVSYTNGEPLELTRSVFLANGRPTNQFGLFFFLFLASALFSLARRRNLLLVAAGVGLFLYFEFGPVQLSVDWSRRELHYMMLFKQERFVLMLTAPLLVLSAYFIAALARRSRLAAVALMLALLGTSVGAIEHTRTYYRSGLTDLRVAADFVRSQPDRIFFGDFWAILHLRIFTGYEHERLSVLNQQSTLQDVKDACVVLGGSRGVELVADYVESTLPAFARDALGGAAQPGWTLVKEVLGDHNYQRAHDLRIYCVAGKAADTDNAAGNAAAQR